MRPGQELVNGRPARISGEMGGLLWDVGHFSREELRRTLPAFDHGKLGTSDGIRGCFQLDSDQPQALFCLAVFPHFFALNNLGRGVEGRGSAQPAGIHFGEQ